MDVSVVLVIDSDPVVVDCVETSLTSTGFVVITAADVETGLRRVAEELPDLVLLERTLPDGDGIEMCVELRRGGYHGGIVLHTHRGAELDMVDGLEAGADDYLVKPCPPIELDSRIRAVLRRIDRHRPHPQTTKATPSGLTVEHVEVRWAEASTPLGHAERAVLLHLIDNYDRVVTSGDLIDRAWAGDRTVSPKALTTTIYRLRARLAALGAPDIILTVRSHGYCLTAPSRT